MCLADSQLNYFEKLTLKSLIVKLILSKRPITPKLLGLEKNSYLEPHWILYNSIQNIELMSFS